MAEAKRPVPKEVLSNEFKKNIDMVKKKL